MKLDATHRGWLKAVMATAVISIVGYIAYATNSPDALRGGSVVGLIFGALGAMMILFAGLLGARKKMIRLRVGAATWWMRGHLWLGLLSLLMALLHGAFQFGGPLTTVLMVLLFTVVISGLVGAALQHVLPGVMTSEVTDEHTYEQLERMRIGLRQEAYELVAGVCGPLDEADHERSEIESLTGGEPKIPKKVEPATGHEHVKEAYLSVVLPYLRNGAAARSPLAHSTRSVMLFNQLHLRVDESLHPALESLADVCEARRQQDRQRRLHRVLHGWLLIHVPLSMALMVLLAVHAVMALYY